MRNLCSTLFEFFLLLQNSFSIPTLKSNKILLLFIDERNRSKEAPPIKV